MKAYDFNRIFGCLMGGAIGDALGAPIEFWSWEKIEREYGPEGLTDFAPAYGAIGRVTDDTQMTLFTLEGLIRVQMRSVSKGMVIPRGVVHHAYLRWLHTQGVYVEALSGQSPDGILVNDARLFSQRAPGNTCLAALSSATGFGQRASNDSKGCGAVMRSAPFGFLKMEDAHIATLAEECSSLTHGHPTSGEASGAFALIISNLFRGERLVVAVEIALAHLRSASPDGETHDVLSAAVELARGAFQVSQLERLGSGWTAHDALAIAVACALAHQDDPARAVITAVNHSGDSDSTGAICGNIIGALHGAERLPRTWRARVELADLIEQMARDFCTIFEDSLWFGDYPRFADDDEEREAARLWMAYPPW